MDPPAAPAAQGDTNSGFQDALSVLRSTHAPSASAHRDASGGLPPVPKADQVAASEAAPSPAAPVKPVNRPAASKNAIIHSVLQRRNPVLPLIRNVGLEIGDISVDYQVGAHNGVLFLSLKYHRLHPEYIHTRIEKIRHAYNLRILLTLCDINEHQQPLRELSKIAIVNGMTMLVAFSNEEAAQYLTTLKAYEYKSADSLKEKVHQTYRGQLEHVLTSGRKVNKSNAEALAAQFGSFANIARQSNHTLSAVKGLGKVKIVSLLDSFNKPFIAGGIKLSDADSTGLPTVPDPEGRQDEQDDESLVAAGDDNEPSASADPEERSVPRILDRSDSATTPAVVDDGEDDTLALEDGDAGPEKANDANDGAGSEPPAKRLRV